MYGVQYFPAVRRSKGAGRTQEVRIVKRIFRRDFIIAVQSAWIISLYLNAGWGVALSLIFPMFFVVLWTEEFAEKRMRIIRLKKILKKLINGNVLPPASKQDKSKILYRDYTTEKVRFQ